MVSRERGAGSRGEQGAPIEMGDASVVLRATVELFNNRPSMGTDASERLQLV